MPYPPWLSRWFTALACVAVAAGCTQLDLRQPIASILPAGDKPQAPTKVVAVWTDAVAQHPAKRASRGFGGRLMFYGRDPDEPVRVDGTLVVYAFEGKGGQTKPDRKYVFKPEQFVNHYSKSKLGHSYSVWIPWDQAGGPKKDIALVCRFDPVEGTPVVSEQTVVALPGSPDSADAQEPQTVSHVEYVGSKQNPVQPAAHQEAIVDGQRREDGDRNEEGTMKTATIPISPHFGRLTPVAETRRRAAPPLANPHRPYASVESKAGADVPNPMPTATSARLPQGPSTPPPSTDYRLGGPPAPTSPSARPTGDHDPRQPRPATSPFPARSLPAWATGS